MKQILVHWERCLGCRSCELACATQHSETKTLFSAIYELPLPKARVFVEQAEQGKFPLQCRHCQEPKCVSACIGGAMTVDSVTGQVLNNPDKCVGCWMCVMVCPFGAIVQDTQRKLALKCDRCSGEDVPACTKSCPTKALVYQEVETFSQGIRQEYLTKFINGKEG